MARKRSVSNLHRLTVREVQAAGDGDHADGGRLLLRLRGQSASWVFRYTAATGRRREMGLGVARRGSSAQAGDALTLARRLAHEARELLQAGRDPIDEREQRRGVARELEAKQKATRARERRTLARVAREYHEGVIEPSRTAKHAAQWIASLEHHVPAELWHARIDSIDAPDSDATVPETLKCVRHGLDAVFDGRHLSRPVHGQPGGRRAPRAAGGPATARSCQYTALPYPDAPAFMAKLRRQQGIGARCLEFAVLTAARTGEAIAAQWHEFDLVAALWTVPAERMKAGESHAVHLSARAVEILDGLRGVDDVFVFPSPMVRPGQPTRPVSNMAMPSVPDRLGERGRTTVDGLCRATFSTWADETAAARPDVVEACLAHRESDRLKAAYNLAKFNAERRALLEAWTEYLARPAAENVVPIQRAA